jgi:hypothetical protein
MPCPPNYALAGHGQLLSGYFRRLILLMILIFPRKNEDSQKQEDEQR